MTRPLRWYDYLSVNIYFLGLTIVSQTNIVVIPLLVQQFIGQEAQGSFTGTLRLWTLMIALLAQAFFGMLSDRSTLPWGRRRPFILIGTVLDLVFIALIAYSERLQGMTGYTFLFIIVILLQISSNIAQSAQQGLIPDLVPQEKRGIFSGIKSVLEVPLPLILIALFIGPLIKTNMSLGIFIAMGILLLTMLLTMLAPEKRNPEKPAPLDWMPIVRLVGMTVAFTAIILVMGSGVGLMDSLLANVQQVSLLLIVIGVAGLIAMLLAIAFGVWFSVNVSIGREAARKNRSYTWWVINRLAFLVGAINLSTFAVFFIQGRLGFEKRAAAGPASTLIMFVGIFILVSALGSGWLADRFGRKMLVMVAGLLAAAGVFVALTYPSLTVIYIGGCLIGIGTGLFYTANWALGTDLVPKDQAGKYLGISNLAGAGAGAVGAYIGGPIADFFTVHVPQSPGLGYLLIFVIYGLLFLLSAAALTQVSPRQLDAPAVPSALTAIAGD